MNLPNYFLADLPPDALLTPEIVTEACRTLKRNRQAYLVTRITQNLIEVLCGIAESWLDPQNRFRRLALEFGPAATGFSSQTIAEGLDRFFRQLTPERFQGLLIQEFGDARRLDRIVATIPEERSSRSAIATAPSLTFHVAAGNIPVPAISSLVSGILLRSAQVLKCARGTSLLPRLFAHSIYEAEPKLGACLEVVEWRGGNVELESAMFTEADCITATGNDETLASIGHRAPRSVRFVGYGHRVSFAFITAEKLSSFHGKRTAAFAADDIVAWDQLGCLSPHVIYVENRGTASPEQFAELLAGELAKREGVTPRGKVNVETAATIASRRSFYEVRAAHSPDTRMWSSANSTAWTVIHEADPRFQLSCLYRFVYVKSVPDLKTALEGADEFRHHVSTIGIAASEDRSPKIAEQLARWGATRVCPLGQMQNPPLAWRHDGRPALGEWVTWTDVEIP